MTPSLDLELDTAKIYSGPFLAPGTVELEDLKPMTVRQMQARYPLRVYNCAAFVDPCVHEWIARLEGETIFYGNISDAKVHPEEWR